MSADSVVPRQLHRILVGGYDPGPESERWWTRFATLHPNWELHTWNDPDPSDWELGHLFSSCRTGAQLADLMRVELLWKHGGVYVDTDVEPLRPLDPLLDHDIFLGTEDGRVVSNSIIGSVSGHAALRAVMDRLLEYQELPGELGPNETTGPEMWTRVLAARDDVLILPRVCFYPYNPKIGIERPNDGLWDTNAYCVHHWAGTWVDQYADSRGRGRLQQARNALGAVVRSRVEPTAARVADRVFPSNSSSPAVYVGNNRVLLQTLHGFPMQVPADDLSLGPPLALEGTYDPRMMAVVEQLVRPGDWVIDVGANVGFLTLAAAHLVGPQGRVVAIEASSELVALLRENVEMNYLRNTQLVEAAAGAEDGSAEFHMHPRFRGSSVAGIDVGSERAVTSGFTPVQVPVRRVDDIVPDVVPVRLVKIDVEGGESDVLQGMSAMLEDRRVDYILVEVLRSNAGPTWPDLIGLLRDLVQRFGAHLFVPSRSGSLQEVSVTEVEVREEYSQLLVGLSRPLRNGFP